jgi:hypothetical protein
MTDRAPDDRSSHRRRRVEREAKTVPTALNGTDGHESGQSVVVLRADGERAKDYLCRVFEAIYRRPPTPEERDEMAEGLPG